jgi:hypothetical protein
VSAETVGGIDVLSASTAATGGRIVESVDITTEVRILFSMGMNVDTAYHAFKFQPGVIVYPVENGHSKLVEGKQSSRP